MTEQTTYYQPMGRQVCLTMPVSYLLLTKFNKLFTEG
jgi:hypothetical protein